MFQQAAAAVAALQTPTTLDHGCVAAMLPYARTPWDVHAMVAWGALPGGWHPEDAALLTMQDMQLAGSMDAWGAFEDERGYVEGDGGHGGHGEEGG